MHRISINELTTMRWSFPEDVSRYVEHEISAIGLCRRKLSDFGEERGIDLLAENSLTVSAVMWAGGFTGSDGRRFNESVQDAEDAIRLAAAVRAGCLVVYSGGRNGHLRKHAGRLLRQALCELIPLAIDYDVTLAIKPMHPRCAEQCSILTSWDAAIELIEEFASPRLQMVLDTYHLGFESHLVERIARNIDRIALVQLGDARRPPNGEQNRCRLGEGQLPQREIIHALLAGGYQGDFDVKLLGEDLEPVDYDELIDHSKRAIESLIAGAQTSRAVL